MFFQKKKKWGLIYQDDRMSPEYIFHNQYPTNCYFKSIYSFYTGGKSNK